MIILSRISWFYVPKIKHRKSLLCLGGIGGGAGAGAGLGGKNYFKKCLPFSRICLTEKITWTP